MGMLHREFDINDKWDRSMITSYPRLETELKQALQKRPDDELLLYHYTWISSWNQLVKFYVEMINDKSI